MKLIGAAILVSRGVKVLQPAPQLILIVRRWRHKGGTMATDSKPALHFEPLEAKGIPGR
jgi:hypothetical protein